tara:strand:+ start:366 stop:743 length:378 start_codon:yes stop_codon:yes gene_type:complete
MGYYTVVAEYPAYKVLAGTEKRFYAPGDVMRIDGGTFELSDVMSYALSNGQCPFAAHHRASANRHELYFAFSLGACLSNSATKQEVVFAQAFGDVITYAGKKFRLVKANNNNVKMVEVEVEVEVK